jgi:V8-like Glu-specific endopeptidase
VITKTRALFVALLLFVAATGSSAAAELGSPQTPEAAPCLTGDPFELADLAEVIADDTPPTIPVVINRHITVQVVGKGNMSDGPNEMVTGRTPSGNPNPNEPPADTARLDNVPLRVFNTRTQFDFRVTFSDELLRTIYECHQRNGLTAPGGPASNGIVEGQTLTFLPFTVREPNGRAPTDSASPSLPIPAGWSDGDDTRILRTPTTTWPWRTITNSSTGATDTEANCTLTLIGPRHLVTAAHCLVDFGTSSWKTRLLTPGRDGQAISPYGSSWMDPTPPPGEEAWYIVPDPWLNPNTPSDDAEEYQWDIGAVLMLDRLGDQTGWMGYGAYPASDLNNRNQINRGYPGCDKTEAPANCQSHRLYGDTEYCDIGEYHHPGSNNWNREFSFDCDISRGHSGSPLYHYRYVPSWGANGPYVAAVVSWHECTTCDEDDDYPNHARRITPWVRDWISWLREQFP